MDVNTAGKVIADTAADTKITNAIYENTAMTVAANAATAADIDTAVDTPEAPGLLREAPRKLRVLIVTHGGVIRQWLAKAESGVTFHTAAAPPPGTVAVIPLRWTAGGWAWRGTDA
jgi:hypothetical protein